MSMSRSSALEQIDISPGKLLDKQEVFVVTLPLRPGIASALLVIEVDEMDLD